MPKDQRREMSRLAREAEAVIEGDRRFFRRHSDRMHRIRLAGRAEAQTIEAVNEDACLLPGEAWFTAVRQIAPGFRTRLFFTGPAENEVDIPEEQCRRLYERVRSKHEVAAEVERHMENHAASVRKAG